MKSTENIEFSPKKFMQTATIIHVAILLGVIIFAIIIYVGAKKTHLNYNDLYVFILLGVAFTTTFMGNFLFRKQINTAKEKETLREKLTIYQTASIIKYALIEVPAFLGIIFFQSQNNLSFLIIVGILIIYLLNLRPTKLKIETDLNLMGEHKSQFNIM